MIKNALTVNEDQTTLDYFDNFTPHYNPERFQFAIDYLNENFREGQNLLDIGCGDGATLYLLKQKTPITSLCGIDISANYLRKAEEKIACTTIEGSILDDELVAQYAGQFDYCTLGAVIHHLIGNSRKESIAFAKQCLRNSIQLLKPGGALLIFEPTYGPSSLMTGAFWIKKLFSRLSNRRVELLRSWANLGQPIVSYYTSAQLTQMAKETANTSIIKDDVLDNYQFLGVIERKGIGMIIKRHAQ